MCYFYDLSAIKMDDVAKFLGLDSPVASDKFIEVEDGVLISRAVSKLGAQILASKAKESEDE